MGGVFSVNGEGWPPYLDIDEQWTNRPAPQRTAAVATATVACSVSRYTSAGEKTLSPSYALAAQWNTTSAPATRWSNAGLSRQSARSKRTPSGRLARSPPTRLSIPETSQPRLRKCSATWLPRNPATPVTKVRGIDHSHYGFDPRYSPYPAVG